MEKEFLQHFQQSITQHRDTLQNWLNSDQAKKEVYLGDASVKDVLHIVSEFRELLEKIEQKNFGKCDLCHGEIEPDRLEQDFTTNICLDCYSKDQLRDLERDLELAAKVQHQLLPCCTPSLEGVQIAFHSKSARVVGGDYHDFFSLKNGCQGIAIGDVMGKGLPASMLMSNLQASLRILGPEYNKLGRLAAHLNRLFRYNLKLIKFISLFLGSIDLAERKFTYCNAGHHSPLWLRTNKNSVKWLKPTSPAIGLIPDAEFKASEIKIEKDDILVLYTDGLIESRNHEKEEFGEERLIESVKIKKQRTAEELVADIWNDVNAYATNITDDVTLIVIRFG